MNPDRREREHGLSVVSSFAGNGLYSAAKSVCTEGGGASGKGVRSMDDEPLSEW